jgi:hypothetical protein
MVSGGMMSAMLSIQTPAPPCSDNAASDAASNPLSALDTDGKVSAEELATTFSLTGTVNDASKALVSLDGDSGRSLYTDARKAVMSSGLVPHEPKGQLPPGRPRPSAEDGANSLVSTLDEDDGDAINV